MNCLVFAGSLEEFLEAQVDWMDAGEDPDRFLYVMHAADVIGRSDHEVRLVGSWAASPVLRDPLAAATAWRAA